MKKRKPTVARGGVIERDLVRRWARRQQRFFKPSMDQYQILEALIVWLKGQPKRTKRKGGIGR